jgi:hypothetical protein
MSADGICCEAPGRKQCKNCEKNIVRIMTIDGVGWYHPIGEYEVQKSCNANGIGFPVAEPVE